jgi:amino acid adenylation domain-containing protein
MAAIHNIAEWAERSADRVPDRPAVETASGEVMSYRELATLARRLDARLRALGLRRGDRVGVCMKKSIDTLVAFQAILRGGFAYVPTDPLAPLGRAAFALDHSGAAVVLVDEEYAERLRHELDSRNARPVLLVVPGAPRSPQSWRIEALGAEEPAESIRAVGDDLAFLLYTSGSTGTPKAVILTHLGIISFVNECAEVFAVTEHDKLATPAPLHFSLSAFNVYVAWKQGGAVVLVDERTAKVARLLAPVIEARRVTVWFSTPTVLTWLAQSGALQGRNLVSLRLVMFGGEPFPPGSLRMLQAQLGHPRYVHVLGSTETNIMAWYTVPSPIADDCASVPVGHVCDRFRYRIVDEHGRDAAMHEDGELWLAGPAVAAGYWNAPDEAARAFPLDERGAQWYRTGDIVRCGADDNLLYRGRRDRLVKKRGNRIELAEIDACLTRNDGVVEAATVAVSDEALGLQVHAFVVPRAGTRPSVVDLKLHCAQTLPTYMIPDAFVFEPALPRTSSGKIDFPKLQHLVSPTIGSGD